MKQIDMLNYHTQFIGNLLTDVTNETKDQIMVISMQNLALEDIAKESNDERLKKIHDYIQSALQKESNVFESLNFREDSFIGNLNMVFDIVKTLTISKSSSYLNMEISETIPISCKASYLIYLLSEIIIYLSSEKIDHIRIVAKKENEATHIIIENSYAYEETFITKLKAIVGIEDKIQINLGSDKILEIKLM